MSRTIVQREAAAPSLRSDAKLLGTLTYSTGNPCIRAHIAPRYTSSGECTACKRLLAGGAFEIIEDGVALVSSGLRTAYQRQVAEKQERGIRRCGKCGTNKDIINFGVKMSSLSGFNAHCKECVADHNKHRYFRDKEIIRLRAAARYADPNNRQKVLAKGRASYAANPETYKNRVKAAAKANPEKIRARRTAYYSQNKQKILRRDAAWRERNLEAHRASSREWGKANPEKRKARDAMRRARFLAAEGKYTYIQIKTIFKAQKAKCAYCKKSLRKGYHADHIMPLALGGTNWINNIQLTCAKCNITKRATHPLDFAQSIGLLL